MNQSKNGYVIAFDGPDGVGKTTQLKLLAETLQGVGRKIYMTRHNGGSPIGEALRDVSLSPIERSAETDLFISLAMGQALSEDLNRRRQSGEIILLDRSPLAVVAYQAYGSQLKDKQEAFDACQKLLKSEAIDVLFYLDASQQIIDDRRQERNTTDYFESKGAAFHHRVRQGYKEALDFGKKVSGTNTKIITVDASGDIETIQKTIFEALPIDITT